MKRETGAVGLLAAAMATVAVVLALLLADVARVVVARSQVTTAADAAALAAAPVTFSAFGTSGDPGREAAAVAAANGARLVECLCPVDHSWEARTVTVTVVVDTSLVLLRGREIGARASAEFRPVVLGSG